MYRLRVDEILKEKSVSMGALSRGANLPVNTVRKIVRNTPGYSPTLDTLMKVAGFLGCTLNDLIKEDPDQDRSGPP